MHQYWWRHKMATYTRHSSDKFGSKTFRTSGSFICFLLLETFSKIIMEKQNLWDSVDQWFSSGGVLYDNNFKLTRTSDVFLCFTLAIFEHFASTFLSFYGNIFLELET